MYSFSFFSVGAGCSVEILFNIPKSNHILNEPFLFELYHNAYFIFFKRPYLARSIKVILLFFVYIWHYVLLNFLNYIKIHDEKCICSNFMHLLAINIQMETAVLNFVSFYEVRRQSYHVDKVMFFPEILQKYLMPNHIWATLSFFLNGINWTGYDLIEITYKLIYNTIKIKYNVNEGKQLNLN